jgi:VWFA-related protein
MKISRHIPDWRAATALLLGLALGAPVDAQAPAAPAQAPYTFHVTSDLVLVNVVARDRSGRIVSDLKSSDFTVLEDGKAQQIRSFDLETPDAVSEGPAAPAPQLVVGKSGVPQPPPEPAEAAAAHDRRLLVLVFDLTSMQPEEVARAVEAATRYLDQQMGPADLVAVVSLGNSLELLQDFTSDRARLQSVLRSIGGAEEQGFAPGSTSSDTEQAENGNQFSADDTEYNLFDVDRRLQAIEALAQSMSGIRQKKSLVYFSSGMTRTGLENQAQLRATVNAAVHANVSIYAVDVRGLQALPPTGDAQQASLRGTAAYSGRAVQSELDSNFSSQETLVTLAKDTGGQPLLDNNNLGVVFDRIRHDTSSYYLIGYRSSNKAMDGRYRHITVRVARRDIKLEYRTGYYAGRDFAHFTREDKEEQLQDALGSELPITDLPVYASAEYFRGRGNDYLVPVSIAVPLSAVPAGARPTLDIFGVVREATSKFPVGHVRDTIKLPVPGGPAARKNMQYETRFTLPPGRYNLKVVVRENVTGKIGTFEAEFTVPDMRKAPLKLSSIVLATQSRPATKTGGPLVVGKSELIPSMSHVFSDQQPLTLLYEIYDAAKNGKAKGKDGAGPRVLTYAQFFRGDRRVYQTPVLELRAVTHADRGALSAELHVPAAQLRAGWYTCQVTAVDDVAGTFGFVRLPIRVVAQPAAAAAPPAQP